MKKRVKVPFLNSNTTVPVIKAKIGHESIFCLVDTGAESTVFDTSIKDKLMVNESGRYGFVGFSGESRIETVEASAYIKLETEEGESLIETNGFVNDLSFLSKHFSEVVGEDCKISIILGSNTLDKYGVKIDYVNKNITL